MNLKVVITLLGVAVSALAMPRPPAYSEVNVVVRYIDYGHHEEHIGSQKTKDGSDEVDDPKMHDVKNQQEEREEDQEVENKKMSEPDEGERTVKCCADKHDGYKAPDIHQQQQSTTSNINDHNEEQEQPELDHQEPAPVEEEPFNEKQAMTEDNISEDKQEIYKKKKPTIVDYKIYHPTQYKHQEKKQKILNRVHGKPKYYRGSYKGEQQGDLLH